MAFSKAFQNVRRVSTKQKTNILNDNAQSNYKNLEVKDVKPEGWNQADRVARSADPFLAIPRSKSHNIRDEYYKNLGVKDIQSHTVKPDGWDQAKPFSSIPGPKPLPIVGNLWRYLPGGEFYKKSVLEVLESLRSQYGDIVMFGGIPTQKDQVVLYDPKLIEVLLRNEGIYPVRPPVKAIEYYREYIRKDVFKDMRGLVTVHGEEWFRVRSTVNKILMQPRAVQMYVDVMDEVANGFIDNIRYFSRQHPNQEMPEDFQNEIYKWALEYMGVVVYNKRLGCLDRTINIQRQKMISNSVEVLDLIYKLDYKPSLYKYVNTKNWRKFVEILDFLAFVNINYIEDCIIQIKNRKYDLPEHEQSILEKMMKIDKQIAITMAIDLISGGVDTTGKTAAIVLYFLAKNPEKQEKLRQEIKTYLPHKNSPANKEILHYAPYLKAVIKEANRIAPVAFGVARITVKDLVIGGYQIPKGTQVMSDNILICNEDAYFKKAKSFIPERWLREVDGEYSARRINPFVTLPFGFGPRSCIGKRIANAGLEVVIAKIIRNFKLSWPHKEAKFNIQLFYGIEDPLKFKVEEVED